MNKTVDKPVAVLAFMVFLLPTVGVPGLFMVQDTLKSIVASTGLLVAALVYVWQQRQRTTPLLWHGVIWLPVGLMAYALGSMVWSHTYLAGVEAIRWFLVSLLVWLGLNTMTRENLPHLALGIHLGVFAASVWAALQFWLSLELFPQAAIPASTYINRNFFAEYVVAALPLSVWLLANMRATPWLKWMASSVAFNVVALLMTGTRSALLALLLVVPIMAIVLVRYHRQLAFGEWDRSSRWLVATILVAGIAGLGSIPTSNLRVVQEDTGTTALQRSLQRSSSLADGREYTTGTFSIRADMWKATARMLMAHPVTGVGAGAWEVQIPLYQTPDSEVETDFYAHNDLLQLLSEYGVVVGGLVLTVLLAYLLLAAGTTRRGVGDDLQEAPLRAMTLTSVLALLIVSSAGFPLHLASCSVLLALCLGILAASDARLGTQSPFPLGSVPWGPTQFRAVLSFLVCCTALAIYIAGQAMQAERKIESAIQRTGAPGRLTAIQSPASIERKAQLLRDLREGISINPHYRKLTAIVADQMANGGDWENAVWIWESVATSRPHIAAIWINLARGYSQLGQHDKALDAWQELKRLRPNSPETRALEVILMSNAGHAEEAAAIVIGYFDRKQFDYEMVQAGYAIGYKSKNWPLAIRSLELGNQTWPALAADGYFRLGQIYADPAVNDDAKALAAFHAGLAAVPVEQRDNFLSQVPEKYRRQM